MVRNKAVDGESKGFRRGNCFAILYDWDRIYAIIARCKRLQMPRADGAIFGPVNLVIPMCEAKQFFFRSLLYSL